MKEVLKSVSFVILLLKMCSIFGQELPIQKIIVIDVGHGGKDSGGIGVNGLTEKDVVMDIAQEVLKLNNDLEKPMNIYLTRYGDTLISLSDRTKLAKTLNADLFVSLHCNHSDNPNAKGMEVYVASAESKYSKTSILLAFQLQAAFKKQLGFESRGVKFANFQVLRESVDYCSAILIEMGFLSNIDEAGYFSISSNFTGTALAILKGINNYLKNKL